MISVQSDLKIEVNAKEITLKSKGDLLLLQFPDWSTYRLFRKNLPPGALTGRSILSNPLLIRINGKDVLKLDGKRGLSLKSLGLSLKVAIFEIKHRLSS